MNCLCGVCAGEVPGGADDVRRAELGRERGARGQVPPVTRVQRARRESGRARRPRGHRAPHHGPARPAGYISVHSKLLLMLVAQEQHVSSASQESNQL